jgi:hypothetical protein
MPKSKTTRTSNYLNNDSIKNDDKNNNNYNKEIRSNRSVAHAYALEQYRLLKRFFIADNAATTAYRVAGAIAVDPLCKIHVPITNNN